MQTPIHGGNRRGAGRKPRPEHLVRTQVQRVRLTPEEMRGVRELAAARGLNPPTLLRTLVTEALGVAPRPPAEGEAASSIAAALAAPAQVEAPRANVETTRRDL